MIASSIALKEWAIVVDALAAGQQLLLVRKGGIRDPKGSFELKHREFFLYPTWEHQNKQGIRPEFQSRFHDVAQNDPSTVELSVYAGAAFCAEVKEPAIFSKLERFHIWTPEFFAERMRYKPAEPTLVAVVRAYQLKKPVSLAVKPEFAGCKSWVPLGEPIPVGETIPVLDNRKFREALEEITAVFADQ